MGINTGLDLKKWSEYSLIDRFGKSGRYYYKIARAIDNREVNPNRIRKSLGAENTFSKDLMSYEEVLSELAKINEILKGRIKRSDTKGKTITLKVKYTDFQQITRSKTVDYWIDSAEKVAQLYPELVDLVELDKGIRLLGLTLSNLSHDLVKEGEESKSLQLTLEF